MFYTHSLGSYLHTIWSRRFFWLSLVKLNLEARYRRSLLGIGWSLLQPVGMTAVLCLVFYKIFKLDLTTYASYVFTGMLIWNFITASVLEGCQSIVSGEKYIRSYPLPLAIYPLRTAVGVMIHFLLLLGVTLIVTWAFMGFRDLTPLFSLGPTLLLLIVFSWSVGTVFGIVNISIPDMQHLSGIALQLLFYMTPVFYPPEMLEGRGILSMVMNYNVLRHYILLIRDPILDARFPSGETFLFAGLATLAVFVLAIAMLARNERKLIYKM